jgi:fructosamine-3-kinase
VNQGFKETISEIMGLEPIQSRSMGGGCVSDVREVILNNGQAIVAKIGDVGANLELEGFMLQYLRNIGGMPVPDVIYADDKLLLMSKVKIAGEISSAAQKHAAELLATLHNVTASEFGFECATVIGSLHQPNEANNSWVSFFRDQRLMNMAQQGLNAGQLPIKLMRRIELLAENLENWLDDLASPSLIHGDIWGGNVLCYNGKVSSFIDPAIYYADAEIELAFSTMFNTFGGDFFDRYTEFREIRPGFFEERVDLYNLYPLLVHVRLFGRSYVSSIEKTLKRFGY